MSRWTCGRATLVAGYESKGSKLASSGLLKPTTALSVVVSEEDGDGNRGGLACLTVAVARRETWGILAPGAFA